MLLKLRDVSISLQDYINNDIFKIYNECEKIDSAHKQEHITNVIKNSFHLAKNYNINKNILFAAASLHDIGLSMGDRKEHHLNSYKFVKEDKNLRRWFNEEEIEIIAQACKDHRASYDKFPDSIYGCIVSDADRDIVANTTIKRSIQYFEANKEKFGDEIAINVKIHLTQKFGENGYSSFKLPESKEFYEKELKKLREILSMSICNFKNYIEKIVPYSK